MGFLRSLELRGQKQAAKAAGLLRREAAHLATIESEMLARRCALARGVRDEAYRLGDWEAAYELTTAIREAEETLEKVDRVSHSLESSLLAMGRPSTALAYAALASVELDCRADLAMLGDEARRHVERIGALVVDWKSAKAHAAQAARSASEAVALSG